ncbi:CRISPR-associated helicase Cas3' [Xylanimonas protaetiae]|uniref:CRISPR-associated helicase Cas3 n=1 Tax=Xylanimonas protaetiae TaxID=2509457 RepID=A0A4P6F7C9_9MICO|nr:CRISPR-associated helicase Cas3' [Xylanimonas protaetiae]QAY71395.1 CRISPR-associated helicase Cas3' [Xylanimonas protaetiae]
MVLSDPARSVWAKSWPMNRPEIEEWAPLWRHLRDAAAVAGRLWDEWLPRGVRDLIAKAAGGEDGGRTLVVFLAGVHDIGKATPAFAVQVGVLRDQMHQAGLTMPVAIPERSTMPHGIAGQVILERWLGLRHGWRVRDAATLGSVVGGHHGVTPGVMDLERSRAARSTGGHLTPSGELLGVGTWEAVQDELLDHVAEHVGASEHLVGDAWKGLPTTVLALALSLVVVADWLSSNADLFPLTPVGSRRPLDQPGDDDEARLAAAWGRVHLPRPWDTLDVAATADELLATRFELSEGAKARPVQIAVVEAARTMDPAGILVVEAPMGEGKTEAAMLAAEVLAARTGAGGVLVALPTQATADAMFRRVMRWITRLGAPTAVGSALVPDGGDDAERRSVFLAHGKAWLNPEYAAVPRGASTARDVGRDADGGRAAASQALGGAYVDGWMNGRRKGVLADFVVGTIDQVLFGALQSRHVALRHLALARKVVILDEVHSFDAYMNTYLERALEWLGAYRVPVVALSATLPPSLRDRLVEAYRRGAQAVDRPARRGWSRRAPGAVPGVASGVVPGVASVVAPAVVPGAAADEVSPQTQPAPSSAASSPAPSSSVVTSLEGGVPVSRAVDGTSRPRRVLLETGPGDDDGVVAQVADAVRDGGCVLVVRNTVKRAQETYRALAAELGDDATLLHSRFLAGDRKVREAALVEQLGPPPEGGTRGKRPRRLVVVATQVVEQSLDVDFDLLVTDLAPTDLLLQRIGRLHRHERPADHRPPGLSEARCVVVGADWATSPVELPRGSVAVYGRHLLLRAAAQVLRVAGVSWAIELPVDIAPLVAEAYEEAPLGPADWQAGMAEAALVDQQGRSAAESRARTFRLPPPRARGDLVGWLDGSVGEADTGDGKAQVRDSEDSFEVIVVQQDSGGQWRLPDWLEGEHRGVAGESVPMGEVPRLAARRALAAATVRLPGHVARGKQGDDVLEHLESLVVDAWQTSPDLAGQLVLPLDATRRATIPGFVVTYDPQTGLDVEEVR